MSLKHDLWFFLFIILLEILLFLFELFCSFIESLEEFLLWKLLLLGLIEERILIFELLFEELFEWTELGESFLNRLFL